MDSNTIQIIEKIKGAPVEVVSELIGEVQNMNDIALHNHSNGMVRGASKEEVEMLFNKAKATTLVLDLVLSVLE